ncbi:AAA family ATPase [Streptomyces sp. NPDC056437]|uniref:AAA family ATPase n=1 Tax=Streptomyces sp. NPDC056437 TaxID=3345816 RepID=UPI00369BFD6F
MPRQVSETLFFGRADELSQMGARLGRAEQGEPQIVLIDGPAGIGKTSLVRCFLAGLAADYCILQASGNELEMQLPYGVMTQLVPHPMQGADVTLRELGRAEDPSPALPAPTAVGASFIDALGKF